MSRITDLSGLTSAVYSARHCHEIGCAKCRAQRQWRRRRAWRSRKSTNPRIRDRKR